MVHNNNFNTKRIYAGLFHIPYRENWYITFTNNEPITMGDKAYRFTNEALTVPLNDYEYDGRDWLLITILKQHLKNNPAPRERWVKPTWLYYDSMVSYTIIEDEKGECLSLIDQDTTKQPKNAK